MILTLIAKLLLIISFCMFLYETIRSRTLPVPARAVAFIAAVTMIYSFIRL